MQINISTTLDELDAALNRVADKVALKLQLSLALLTQKVNEMSGTVDAALADLTAKVENETTVNASAVALINGFPALIAQAVAAAQAAGATPDQLAAFDALGKSIQANADELASSVSANTPAA